MSPRIGQPEPLTLQARRRTEASEEETARRELEVKLETLTVQRLRALLRLRDLPVSGLKSDLVRRLANATPPIRLSEMAAYHHHFE